MAEAATDDKVNELTPIERFHRSAHMIGERQFLLMATSGLPSDLLATAGLYQAIIAVRDLASYDLDAARGLSQMMANQYLQIMDELGLVEGSGEGH